MQVSSSTVQIAAQVQTQAQANVMKLLCERRLHTVVCQKESVYGTQSLTFTPALQGLVAFKSLPCFPLTAIGRSCFLCASFISPHHTESRDRTGKKITAIIFIHKPGSLPCTAKRTIVVISHSSPPCSQKALFFIAIVGTRAGKK